MLGGEVVAVLGILVFGLLAVRRRRAGAPTASVLQWLLFATYLLLVAVVVLFPLRVSAGLRADDAVWDYATFIRDWVNLVPFATVGDLLDRSSPTQAMRQLGGNILLLLPLGFLVPLRYPRFRGLWPILLLAVVSAVGIECVQYLARVARLSLRSVDVDDAMLNIVGAMIGYLGWRVWTRGRSRPARAYQLRPARPLPPRRPVRVRGRAP